ncbi:MAG: cell division protein FtsZ [Methanotrichaceae archaeon]|nr:cell division protein FtsZ [Methanotrichaceae archaeon]
MEDIAIEAGSPWAEAPEKEAMEGFGLPKILVIGCGGAGNNTVNRLSHLGVEGAETIAINTDSQHLESIDADQKILIGRRLTRGQGAGGDPALGKKAAESAKNTLSELLQGSDMVFLTAGMGGGTGTGSLPVVAKLAKEQGAIVICMVTTPFHMEKGRVLVSEAGIESLRPVADTLIVMDNNRLLKYAPHLPLYQAFSVVDQIISETIKGITETVTQPSLINLDYADVRTVMSGGGPSFMLVGEGSTKARSEQMVRTALNNPLLDVDYRGAKSCLLHLTGGPDMTLKDAAAVAEALTRELDKDANVIWGARIRPDFRDRIRLMAVITGVRSPQILCSSEVKPQENDIITRIDVIR